MAASAEGSAGAMNTEEANAVNFSYKERFMLCTH
jgi:hypothetical protein